MSLLGFFSPSSTSRTETRAQSAVSGMTLTDSLNKSVSRVSNYSDVGNVRILSPDPSAALDSGNGGGTLLWLAFALAAVVAVFWFITRK